MKRYRPLGVWIVVFSTVILIPLKIIGYGFPSMSNRPPQTRPAADGMPK
jgi:hypothetical protein